MTERSIQTLYTLLIDATEKMMARKLYAGDVELDELQTEILDRVRTPAEGERLIHDEEALLAQCLVVIARVRLTREPDRERLWTQIAGVLLPVVREHFGQAIVAGRRRTAETTDQDYVRR